MDATTPTVPSADPLASMDANPAPAVQAPVVQTASPVPTIVLSTVTKPGSLIDISQVPQDEMAEIEKLASSIILENEDTVTMFAYPMQKDYSDGLSQLLGNSTLGQTKQYEFIAEKLQLSTEIVQHAIDAFGHKDGDVGTFRKMLRSVPFLGKQVTTVEVLAESRKKLVDIFDELEREVTDRQRSVTEKDVAIDTLYKNLKTHLFLLRRHILAGERALLHLYQVHRDKVAALPQNPDPIVMADLIREGDMITGFETRLVGLRNAYVKAGTLLPTQLSGIKKGSQIVLQNLRDTIVLSLPDLKTSALQLVALNELHDANTQTDRIHAQAARAAEQAQELVGQVLEGAVKQQGKVLDEAQQLRDLLQKMAVINNNVAKLEEENAGRREEADKLLAQTKHEFDEASRRTAQALVERSKAAA